MAEYSRLAKGSFTASSGQTTAVVNLPFMPDYVELWNYTNIKTKAASKITRAWWDNRLVDGANNPTMIEAYDSGTNRQDMISSLKLTLKSLEAQEMFIL